MRLHRPSPVSAISVAVCLFGIAGFAYATIPEAGGKQEASGPGDDHVLGVKTLVLPDGQREKLLEHGPFRLIGVCDVGRPSGQDFAEMIIRTSQDHSAVSTSTFSNDSDWLTSEPPVQLVVVSAATADFPVLRGPEPFTAIAPDRTTILTGLPWVGVHVLGRAGRCRFGGHFFTE